MGYPPDYYNQGGRILKSWVETSENKIKMEMSADKIVPTSAQLKLLATRLVERRPVPCNTCGSHGIICQMANLTDVYLENFLHPVICSQDGRHGMQIVCVACSRISSQDIICTIAHTRSIKKHIKRSSKHPKGLQSVKNSLYEILLSEAGISSRQNGTDQSKLELAWMADSLFDSQNHREDCLRFSITNPGTPLVQFLVARSNFHTSFTFHKDTLDAFEAEVDFKACRALSRMSRRDQEVVMDIARSWYWIGGNHMRQDLTGDTPHSHRLAPPDSLAEQDNRYFRGVNSILQNIPHPPVSRFGDHHARVNIGNCMKDALARGTAVAFLTLDDIFTPIDVSRPVYTLTQTRRAREVAMRSLFDSLGMPTDGSANIEHSKNRAMQLIERKGLRGQDVFVCLFIVWTDGIEPNAIKQGRNGVWAGSVTFVPAEKKNWNDRRNTYPLAIGRDKTKDGNGIDHWPVMRDINENIWQLRRRPLQQHKYYCSQIGRAACVLSAQYAYFADQPERRKATGTAPGTQRYHGRFRCRAMQKKLAKFLVPCHSCVQSLENGTIPRGCQSCCCWDALTDGPSKRLLETDPEDGYPMHPQEHVMKYLTPAKKMAPKRVTFRSLLEATTHAWTMFTTKKWTEDQTRKFLESECLEGSLVDKISENGHRKRTLGDIHDGITKHTDEVIRDTLEEWKQNPSKYDLPETPSHWTGGDEISMFVDSPMHLLFLGIVKKVLQVIKAWMLEQGMFRDFTERVKTYNQKLDEIGSLEYLPLQDFRQGKFGGWVSENFGAFERIMLWFFQEIGTLLNIDELEGVVVPNTRPSGWLRKHCLRWLRDRGITEYNNLSVPDLKKKIRELMDLPEEERPNVVERESKYEVGQVEKVLVALHNMIEAVMVDVVVPVKTAEIAELRIKQFLTQFHLLDQQLSKRTKTASDGRKSQHMSVFSCANFTTLLNIPAMLEEFGPLRLLWEGGVHGEAFVKMIKPYLKFGLKDNFAMNAMNHCMQETSFQLTMKEVLKSHQNGESLAEGTEGGGILKLIDDKRRSINRYKSFQVAHQLLSTRSMLTVLAVYRRKEYPDLDDVWILVPIVGQDRVQMHPVMATGNGTEVKKFGSWYHSWKILSHPLTAEEEPDITPGSGWETSFGVLLPIQETTGPALHTLVCESRYTY